MAFYDNIESQTVVNLSNPYTWAFSLLGVVIGFYLTYFKDRRRRKKELKHIFHYFKSCMAIFEKQLKQQYIENNHFLKVIKDDGGVGFLNIVFLYEENNLKSINRIDLFEYYNDLSKKKRRLSFNSTTSQITSEFIHSNIDAVFFNVSLSYIEIMNFVDRNQKCIEKINDINKKYHLEFTKLDRELTNYMYKVGSELFLADPYAKYMYDLLNSVKKGGISFDKLPSLNEILHTPIYKANFGYFEHPLFNAVSSFDAAGKNLLYELSYLNEEKVANVEFTNDHLSRTYKDIFFKNITE
jgi:hypothetical protein